MFSAIILVPRKSLAMNKFLQHPTVVQIVDGDVTNAEIEEYRRTHVIQKFMCTYDSIRRLKGILGSDFMGFRIVVDEFHLILSDSSFKVYTECEMLRELEGHPFVTYVSATPHLDYFLEQMPEFCDLPYYNIMWEDARKVRIRRLSCNRPVDAAIRIVREYMNGVFPFIVKDGVRVNAKEAVIFLNSVENIVNIVRQSGLSPEQVNIICADTAKNRDIIKELGDGFELGRVPLRDERNKLVTLCTSTCYFGVDFYSQCAQVYIVSDCHRVNTAIDISTEIPQIVGRIRNVDNPFRDQVFFIYNTWNGAKNIDEYMEELRRKREFSVREMKFFNSATDEIKQHLIKMIRLEKNAVIDKNSFCFYDEDKKEFAINQMSILSEEYEARVQYSTYHDGTYVFRALEEREELTTDESAVLFSVNEHVERILKKTTFAEEMEKYCEYRMQEGFKFNCFIEDMERENDRLKPYFDALGGERIKALGYKEKALANELMGQKNTVKIMMRLREIFPVGTELSADQYKLRMQKVFDEFGVKKSGKVSDLEKVYGFKVAMHNRVEGVSVRKRYYEIVGM